MTVHCRFHVVTQIITWGKKHGKSLIFQKKRKEWPAFIWHWHILLVSTQELTLLIFLCFLADPIYSWSEPLFGTSNSKQVMDRSVNRFQFWDINREKGWTHPLQIWANFVDFSKVRRQKWPKIEGVKFAFNPLLNGTSQNQKTKFG